MGRFGQLALWLGGLIGALVAAVAIFMEESHRWTAHESLIWFAVSIPVVGVFWQWFCWSKARFALRQ
jgi:hypothetical protein